MTFFLSKIEAKATAKVPLSPKEASTVAGVLKTLVETWKLFAEEAGEPYDGKSVDALAVKKLIEKIKGLKALEPKSFSPREWMYLTDEPTFIDYGFGLGGGWFRASGKLSPAVREYFASRGKMKNPDPDFFKHQD